MDVIILQKPTLDYAEDLMSFRQELINGNEDFAGCVDLRKSISVEEWLRVIASYEYEATCPKGMVTSSSYLGVRLCDKRIVGIIDFRHHIKHPILSAWGGHIGYTVRPGERNKGYGKEMLRQNLENCREYGLDKVLITCQSDNFFSEKIIIANGGVFEKEIKVDDRSIKRYWIYL